MIKVEVTESKAILNEWSYLKDNRLNEMNVDEKKVLLFKEVKIIRQDLKIPNLLRKDKISGMYKFLDTQIEIEGKTYYTHLDFVKTKKSIKTVKVNVPKIKRQKELNVCLMGNCIAGKNVSHTYCLNCIYLSNNYDKIAQ